MHRRYPRSILVTLCIALALAISATLLAGARTPPQDSSGVGTPEQSQPAAPPLRL